jgi:hypothetical protein
MLLLVWPLLRPGLGKLRAVRPHGCAALSQWEKEQAGQEGNKELKSFDQASLSDSAEFRRELGKTGECSRAEQKGQISVEAADWEADRS